MRLLECRVHCQYIWKNSDFKFDVSIIYMKIMTITEHCNYKKGGNYFFLFLFPRSINEVERMLTKQMSLLGILNSGFVCQKPRFNSSQSCYSIIL